MMEHEEWRPVVGYEGSYSISNMGRLRSERTKNNTIAGKILSPAIQRRGYRHAGLYRNGKSYQVGVHVLVAEAFLGPRNGRVCNHKNGITFDNRLENLEWLTHQEDRLHASNVLGRLRGENSPCATLTDDIVLAIRAARDGGESVTSIARRYSLPYSTAYFAAVRRTWTHLPEAMSAKP